MPTTKNPFPTHATYVEERAEVRGMEVRRTSGPGWSTYLVRDPLDPETFASANVRHDPEHARAYYEQKLARIQALGGTLRRVPAPERPWIVTIKSEIPGLPEDEGTADALGHGERHLGTRRHAEQNAFAMLMKRAEVMVYEHARVVQTPGQLLGLDAPKVVERAQMETFYAGRSQERTRRKQFRRSQARAAADRRRAR